MSAPIRRLSDFRPFVRNPLSQRSRFEGPRSKITRAEKHIADFKAELASLMEANPVEVRPYTDPETGYLRTTLRLPNEFPGDLRTIAADALYNLRSALDGAVCRCVATGQSTKCTYFPHGDDLAGFEASVRAKCKKVPEPVRAAIASLEPYHGGKGYLLRVLHDLNVVDKHTDLISVGMGIQEAMLWREKGTPLGTLWRRTGNEFHPMNATEMTPDDIHHQIKIAFAVTFSDVEVVKNQPAAQVLVQLRDLVLNAVDVIEAALPP